jgi:neutral ceramidase
MLAALLIMFAEKNWNAPPSRAQVSESHSRCQDNRDFLIGSGIYDITGPSAGLGMMGYAQITQRTVGIHFRLWSRAFVVATPCNDKRVVFVSADLGQVFQAVKIEVVQKLRKTYGDLYTDENVLLSATHDHAGPGGYSHYKLYNLTIGGFDQQNFDTIADGIYRSIVRAHNDVAPGKIRIVEGEMKCAEDNLESCKTDPECASRNRSPTSYLRNPAEERANYSCNTDTKMTLVKFVRADGREIGEINWFAVHGTSMHNNNRLISGDNKGYASYLFEGRMKTDYDSDHTFVAAFAQTNEGDVTPNLCGGTDGCGKDQFDSTRISGERQANKAVALYNSANQQPLTGGVDYRHTYVKMDEVNVNPQPAPNGDGYSHRTCKAAIGISMLAGADDGPGVGKQGISCQTLPPLIAKVVCEDCQGEKPIAVETGSKNPPWTPPILPLQILTIGDLVIIAVPAEFTTMAGRRLRTTVQNVLQPVGIHYTVIAGLSNAYTQYVATRQEYVEQRYEGASTHFGPWTLAAYQQEFQRLAIALRDGQSVDPGPKPLDVPFSKDHPNSHECKPPWKHFGDVRHDVNPTYHIGETVRVTFWAGHPRNDLKIQSSYLMAQRQDGSSWTTVARDRDWETKFFWRRTLLGTVATIEWTIPPGTVPGYYRIQHDGAYRSNDRIRAYSGLSRTFRID